MCRLLESILLLVLISLVYCGKEPLKPSRIYTDGSHSAYVYDKVLRRRLLEMTSQLVKAYAPWKFTHPDPQEGVERKDNGDLHWYAPFAPKNFANSLIWKGIKYGLKGTGMLDGKDFMPYDVNGIMLLRGFSPVVYKGKNSGDTFLRVFLTSGMKKNDYSELNLYNEKEEIFGSITPKFGRVVVWNDTSDFIFKPPAMNFEQAEYSLLIKTTTDKEKFEDGQRRYLEEINKHKELASRPFPFTNVSDEMVSKINLTKHLRYKFTDSVNRVVAVFDNVVPKEELDAVRNYFYNLNSAYFYDTYDPDKSETHDNVNWIVKVNPQNIVNSRIWKYVHHCASFLSGEDKWYPYDVAMNIIQHTHHTRIHSDCSKKEHEYTFLMYLSPDWHSERYGETIFVEEERNEATQRRPGQEKYNTLSAVIPKYGRIVVFRNIIDHSARPPSPDFLGARYTFAVKVGRSPEIAIAKALREKLEMFQDEPKALKLQEEIYEGKYDTYDNLKNKEFLEKNLEFYQTRGNELKQEGEDQTFQSLKFSQRLT